MDAKVGLVLAGNQQEDLLRILTERIEETLVLLDASGRVTFLNNPELGLPAGELTGAHWTDFVVDDQRKALYAAFKGALGDGVPREVEFQARRPDGDKVWFAATLTPLPGSGAAAMLLLARNITDHKLLEFENETKTHLVALADPARDLHDAMADLTGFLQRWSGCEAVGVRLRDGDDYPYFETRGFPAAFVAMERHLCDHDPGGEVRRDAGGNPDLACMCGNILCGRYDPAQSFFTVGGTFWSNHTSRLLAETSEDERQARTRNRCNGAGYESVALIPLRSGTQVFGLLQFNDHHPDRFTRALIGRLEKMTSTLALALSQRQAAVERIAGEKLYHSLFQSMLNGFAYCRMLYEGGRPVDFVYLDVNDAFQVQTGLRDVVGRRVTEVIPGIREQDPELFEIYGRVARTGQPERFELRVAALAMWFHLSVYSPAPEHFVAVFDVITERKQAEEALRLSEEKFALAFRRMPTMMSLTDLGTGRYVDMNDAFLHHTGYSREELLGRTTTEIGWLGEELQEQIILRLGEAGHLSDLTSEFHGKDGRRLTCLFSCELVEVSGKPRVLSTFQDITPLIRTQEALLATERRYRSLFQDSPTGLWLEDFSALEQDLLALRAGAGAPLEAHFAAHPGQVRDLAERVRVLEINQAGLRMFGLEETQGIPERITGFLAPATLEILGHAFAALAEGATAFRSEVPRLDRQGRTKWFDLSLVVQPDAGGGLSRVLVGFVDITERRTAEEGKAKLSAQLLQAQKMESLGNLAGGVAHDMNNVLGAILALASANLQVHPPDSFAYRTFETINQAAVRGGDMVKRLLTFARRNPIQEQDVDLNRLLREEVRLLERTTLAKVRLDLDLGAGVRAIRGDESALAHAIMNLCVNAVDAMPEGGTLTLRTRDLEDAGVEVLVADTGTGMPAEVLERALDPYFTTKAEGKGTGLGLPLVYSTVQSHQGSMELESAPGEGTRVRLRFPACDPGDGPEEAAPGPRALPAHRALEVLLVDDDDLVQRSTGMLLAVLGHGCVITASGEEALERVEAGFQPDLVILDMNMPGLGGAGTLPRLRALCPEVPILLATGRADQTALDLAASFHRVTLLSKPFSLEELQGHLRSQCAPEG